MKKILIFVMLSLIAGAVFAQTIEVKVKGMVCSFCAQGLDKKFKAEPSIETVKVELKKQLLSLTLKENSQLTDEQIKAVVTDAGYNVDSIIRK